MPKKDQAVTGEAFHVLPLREGSRSRSSSPGTLVKRGVKREVITPLDAPEAFREEVAAERQARKASEESALVSTLGLAQYWHTLLDSGKARTLAEIAEAEGINKVQVSPMRSSARWHNVNKLMPLAAAR